MIILSILILITCVCIFLANLIQEQMKKRGDQKGDKNMQRIGGCLLITLFILILLLVLTPIFFYFFPQTNLIAADPPPILFKFSPSNFSRSLTIHAFINQQHYQVAISSQDFAFNISEIQKMLEKNKFTIRSHSIQNLELKVGSLNIFKFKNVHLNFLKELQEIIRNIQQRLRSQSPKYLLFQTILGQLKSELLPMYDEPISSRQIKLKNFQYKIEILNQIINLIMKNVPLDSWAKALMQFEEKKLTQTENENVRNHQLFQKITSLQRTIQKLDKKIEWLEKQKVHDGKKMKALKQKVKKISNHKTVNTSSSETIFDSDQFEEIKVSIKKIYENQKKFQQYSNETQSSFNRLKNQVQKMQRNLNDFKTNLPQNGNQNSADSHHSNEVKQFKFSQTNKHKEIEVGSNTIVAWGKKGFILTEGPTLQNGDFIRFKVEEAGFIGVGLGIKSTLVENKFEARWSGYFMNMDNGEICSSSNMEDNDVYTGVRYDAGDVIKVTAFQNRVIFLNEKSGMEFKMSISLTDEQWNEACFCVYTYPGKVSIVQW